MAKPRVSLATVGENATVSDVLAAIAQRLDSLQQVLAAEHKWLASIVELTRKVDAMVDIEQELADGWIDEEEAERRRTTYELHVPKVNIEKHQSNINASVIVLVDAAKTLSALADMTNGEARQ